MNSIPEGWKLVPVYATHQNSPVRDSCPRCKGRGVHVTGTSICPALSRCKMCSKSNLQEFSE